MTLAVNFRKYNLLANFDNLLVPNGNTVYYIMDTQRIYLGSKLIAAANVLPDWSQNDSSSEDYIKNKPDFSIYALDSDVENLEEVVSTAINLLQSSKVDKEAGKGLSTNDFTTSEKDKLAGIAAGAQVNVLSNWNQTNSNADDYIKNKPAIVDNTTSVSTTDALSANAGYDLQQQINRLKSIGKFLSVWSPITGLPQTDPNEMPYLYQTGDYYLIGTAGNVENITAAPNQGAAFEVTIDLSVFKAYVHPSANMDMTFKYDIESWTLFDGSIYNEVNIEDYGITVIGTPEDLDTINVTYQAGVTNYRPTGATYTGTASSTVETAAIQKGDMYIYDGTLWVLQLNHQWEVPVDSELSLSSVNPVENRVITQAISNVDNIYIVNYETPDYTEAVAAFNANKIVLANIGGQQYIAVSITNSTNNLVFQPINYTSLNAQRLIAKIVFEITQYYLNNNNTWSLSTDTLTNWSKDFVLCTYNWTTSANIETYVEDGQIPVFYQNNRLYVYNGLITDGSSQYHIFKSTVPQITVNTLKTNRTITYDIIRVKKANDLYYSISEETVTINTVDNLLSTSKADALSANQGRILDTLKADKATTLEGYGIIDASIYNGTITLGAGSITPELMSNKVTVLDSSCTDDQYPSAKVVYDEMLKNEYVTAQAIKSLQDIIADMQQEITNLKTAITMQENLSIE